MKEEKLILMYKDYEVLSFLVNYQNGSVKILEKLEHFDKGPYGINTKERNPNSVLHRFFNSRIISRERWDYKEILKGVGCNDVFELSFKGHGLSLSNHFWFKREGENLRYESINFFTNKWDDSFGRAVLRGDYKALKNCDLNVPDIVTPGWSVKAWIYDNGPKLYKFGIVKDHFEDCLGEVLASKFIQRILKDDEVVKYELIKVGNQFASVSPVITGIDEELVPISNVLPCEIYNIYLTRNRDRKINEEFFKKVAEFGMPELYEFFVKLSVIRTLCFVSDLHFENISVIRNTKTNKIRVAPFYDLAGAFGSSRSGREFISKINKGSYFIVYFLFGDLKPNWDYSWYDPSKLIGFEEDIKDILSKSDFYTPEIIERIIEVYHQQKETLDKIAKQLIV